MELRGKVKDGRVQLDEPLGLPEGTEVRVQAVRSSAKRRTKKKESLAELLVRHAGTVKGMPKDLARNYDHYLYGRAKR